MVRLQFIFTVLFLDLLVAGRRRPPVVKKPARAVKPLRVEYQMETLPDEGLPVAFLASPEPATETKHEDWRDTYKGQPFNF